MDTASSISISPEQFIAAIGAAEAPLVLDVRREARFRESERIAPAARRCDPADVARLATEQAPGRAVVYCVHGLEVGANAAAQLRAAGWDAVFLQGGIDGLVERGLPTVRKRPNLGVTSERPSRWVTRERPKIDRIACPWLVRRFIDPSAQFFYVPTAQVFDEARRLEAVAFDIPGAPIEHDGANCSFDTLLSAFDLHDTALDALARIVRGADTDRLDLAPQSAGLLALSLGFSRVHGEDDLGMLDAMMPVYDALLAWCRASQGEPHNWNPDLLKAAR
ncbi:MAG: chromate resistance protein ChrB domain-containing protein [Variovorax sp.]